MTTKSLLLAALTLSTAWAADEQKAVQLKSPVQTYQALEGSYPMNVLRRRGADGTMETKVTLDSKGAKLIGGSDPQVVINGSEIDGLRWQADPANLSAFECTLLFELKEALPINQIQTFWLNEKWEPAQWNVAVSSDGKNFKTVATHVPDDVKPRVPDQFPTENVRYIRIQGKGAEVGPQPMIALGQVKAFLSESASAPTAMDGYSIGQLPGLTMVSDTPAGWHGFGNLLPGHTGHFIQPEPKAAADAAFHVDLKGLRDVEAVRLTFRSAKAGWQYGASVAVSTSEKGPWTTIFDSHEPFYGQEIKVPAGTGPIGFIKVVDRLAPDKSGIGTGGLSLVEIYTPRKPSQVLPTLAKIPVAKDQQISAGIFDSTGRLVRTLAMSTKSENGSQTLVWDGYDELGRALPSGDYEWRAILTEAHPRDDGSVGDSGVPPRDNTESLGGLDGVAYDADGNLFQAAWWEERHQELRKTSPDGKTLWEHPFVGAIALAADKQSVFLSVSPYGNGEDRIYRVNAQDGTDVPFPDGKKYFVVNPDRPKKSDAPPADAKETYTFESLDGLALDPKHIWVTNYLRNRVNVFDRESGADLGGVDVTEPVGLAVRSTDGATGQLWVTSGNKVLSFTFDGAMAFKPAAPVEAGSSPAALSLNPAGDLLAVTDRDDAVVRFYVVDKAGGTKFLRQFGHAALPGKITGDAFRPSARPSIALNPANGWTLADNGNRRLLTFDAKDQLLSSSYSEFQPAPFVFDATPETHHLLSGPWEYLVDLSGSHKGDPLWYGNGTWTLEANWAPADRRFASTGSLIRTFPNGKKYLIFLGRLGLMGYELKDGGMRRSFIFSAWWTGLQDTEKRVPAIWFWKDSNGNGQIDWDPANAEANNGEINFFSKPGVGNMGIDLRAPGCWVDDKGNIWLAKMLGQVVKLPLQGFDDHDNPIYDFEKREVVVKVDKSGENFGPNNLRTSPSGDIYVLGFSKTTGSHPFLWMGGREIRHYSPAGELLSRFIVPQGDTVVSFDFDWINPDILYTAHNKGGIHQIRAWSKDGLCLAMAEPAPDISGVTGWVDGFMGIAAFSPDGKQHMAYAEDVWHGKSVRYVFADLGEKQRLSGKIKLEAAVMQPAPSATP